MFNPFMEPSPYSGVLHNEVFLDLDSESSSEEDGHHEQDYLEVVGRESGSTGGAIEEDNMDAVYPFAWALDGRRIGENGVAGTGRAESPNSLAAMSVVGDCFASFSSALLVLLYCNRHFCSLLILTHLSCVLCVYGTCGWYMYVCGYGTCGWYMYVCGYGTCGWYMYVCGYGTCGWYMYVCGYGTCGWYMYVCGYGTCGWYMYVCGYGTCGWYMYVVMAHVGGICMYVFIYLCFDVFVCL